MTSDAICATDGRYKLMRRASYDQLFDLKADPLEISSIPSTGRTGDIATIAKRLLAAIETAERQQIAKGVQPQETSEGLAEMDESERAKLEQQMKLLGYM
jgi:hypothetical protein